MRVFVSIQKVGRMSSFLFFMLYLFKAGSTQWHWENKGSSADWLDLCWGHLLELNPFKFGWRRFHVWPHGNGEIILSLGRMGLWVGIQNEDEWAAGQWVFPFWSHLLIRSFVVSHLLFYKSQNEPVGSLILTSMVGSLMISPLLDHSLWLSGWLAWSEQNRAEAK